MQVAHLLRKYNPAQWGGTETAVKRLLDSLRHLHVHATVFCPRLEPLPATDPLAEAGHVVRRFNYSVPVAGISKEQRDQLVSVGGNLLSFQLMWQLMRLPELSLIHTHVHNRLGGIALTVARLRRVPLVVTIHGGVLDLPRTAQDYLAKPLQGGVEWGKGFGVLLRSRKVLQLADAILTCNKKEAELLQQKYPGKKIITQPHGVPAPVYQKEHRAEALAAFPRVQNRKVLLAVGRIDAVKNQKWLIQQAKQLLSRHPETLLVLAGSCTDAAYGKELEEDICRLGLGNHVLLTGGLPPGDPRLIGLFQLARALVLPSISETFGLVILEAWACQTPVISSRTSGAIDLVREGENGWLFALENPATFHQAVEIAMTQPALAKHYGQAGLKRVLEQYDSIRLGAHVKNLYLELLKEKR